LAVSILLGFIPLSLSLELGAATVGNESGRILSEPAGFHHDCNATTTAHSALGVAVSAESSGHWGLLLQVR
jgi:hypothetical protein